MGVLSTAIQEIARAVAPAQQAVVVHSLSTRVATIFDRQVAAANEAITVYLVALPSTLGLQAAVVR